MKSKLIEMKLKKKINKIWDLSLETQIATLIYILISLINISSATSINKITIIDQETIKENNNFRLPQSIKPITYNIEIIPFFKPNNFTFSGRVSIICKCLEDTNNITLHALSLNIKEEDVIVSNILKKKDLLLTIEKSYFVKANDFFIIKFGDNLKKGNLYKIDIKYTGKLLEGGNGFFFRSYISGNETRWMAATHFEPVGARKVFPCFDEPALKATFKLSIGRPKNMTTIANMPKLGKPKLIKGLPLYVMDIYEESVIMSTYLVCFAITDFSNKTSGNFSVFARPDVIDSASYALEIGPKILNYFEKVFNVDYPISKMDMIAIPQFNGAMENWGLITYREETMLLDVNSSLNDKLYVINVVTHELAHQWFGNLVTLKWWNDLWLNEGFATYLEYLGVDAVEPSLKLMENFIVDITHVMFIHETSKKNIFSVSAKLNNNSQDIIQAFSTITYSKGATIIRMMDHFLTTKVFFSGLSQYLKKYSYKSVEQDDLWDVLTEVAHSSRVLSNEITVKKIMDSWTLQIGFPLVTVKCNFEEKSIYLTQSKYNINTTKNNTGEESTWWIPITYTTSKKLNFKNTKPSQWISGPNELTIKDSSLKKDNWIIMNIQQNGYYRVNYENDNWQLIINYLKNRKLYKKIAPSNRAQIIDDSFNLALDGYINYTIPLDISKYLLYEIDYVPWKAAIESLNIINSKLKTGNTQIYHKFQKYYLKLLENVYNDVAFEDNKDFLTSTKRNTIINISCKLGSKHCNSEAIKIFRAWTQNIANIDPNINKEMVYCTIFKYGNTRDWEFILNEFINIIVNKEYINYSNRNVLRSVECITDYKLFIEFLKTTYYKKFGQKLRLYPNDQTIFKPRVKLSIIKYWDNLIDSYGSLINKNSESQKIIRDFAGHLFYLNKNKEKERINNSDWMKKHYKTIADWLNQNDIIL